MPLVVLWIMPIALQKACPLSLRDGAVLPAIHSDNGNLIMAGWEDCDGSGDRKYVPIFHHECFSLTETEHGYRQGPPVQKVSIKTRCRVLASTFLGVNDGAQSQTVRHF